MSKGMWGFPRIMGTFLVVPIIRIMVYWGLYWGPSILGNYHVKTMQALQRPSPKQAWEEAHMASFSQGHLSF